MSASKRGFEKWAEAFCDFENIDRPFNGYHNYPTMYQLQKLYSLGVEPTFRNALALGKFNNGEWSCLEIGNVENEVGVHISTCRGCYDSKVCEQGEEE